ncbi:acyl-CoA dehydrogenase family protein, partial [Achromobacter aegrifaciens]|uniref:acyl-CoA dehydrogenase family protein n=1 Tax=Achromobacter aegrifaciens TaxID=1287736 RepID=UPI001FCA7202
MLLTDEQLSVQEMARRFAQERLAPNSERWDRDHHYPADAIAEMAQLGFFGMLVPEAWDGNDSGYISYAVALEEIAAGNGACSTIMSVHNSVACMPILKFGTDAQKEQFLRPLATGEHIGAFALTEPQAGSDASSLRTRARRDGDDYILNGAKQFITSGRSGQVVIVFAVTDPDAGKRGISAFIVPTDTPGYKVLRVEEKLGQHASDTCQIAFEDMRIPAAYRLGAEGEGYKIALSNLEGGRIGIASQSVGMARAAYECGRRGPPAPPGVGPPHRERQERGGGGRGQRAGRPARGPA